MNVISWFNQLFFALLMLLLCLGTGCPKQGSVRTLPSGALHFSGSSPKELGLSYAEEDCYASAASKCSRYLRSFVRSRLVRYLEANRSSMFQNKMSQDYYLQSVLAAISASTLVGFRQIPGTSIRRTLYGWHCDYMYNPAGLARQLLTASRRALSLLEQQRNRLRMNATTAIKTMDREIQKFLGIGTNRLSKTKPNVTPLHP